LRKFEGLSAQDWFENTHHRRSHLLLLQEAATKGVRETVHVLITTYTEPADTVRECLIRLIVAPEPVYMEKQIYVCDDGHSKSEGPKKRAMVEELRILGMFLHSPQQFEFPARMTLWTASAVLRIGLAFPFDKKAKT
jgi:hypothetical protein